MERLEMRAIKIVVLTVAAALSFGCTPGGDSKDTSDRSPIESGDSYESGRDFVEVPPQKIEQQEFEIKRWCKKDRSHDPDSCYCDTETPSWKAADAESKGHRVSHDVIRADDGTIKYVIVNDYFMPNDGSAYSGFSNMHIYFPSIEACRADAKT